MLFVFSLLSIYQTFIIIITKSYIPLENPTRRAILGNEIVSFANEHFGIYGVIAAHILFSSLLIYGCYRCYKAYYSIKPHNKDAT